VGHDTGPRLDQPVAPVGFAAVTAFHAVPVLVAARTAGLPLTGLSAPVAAHDVGVAQLTVASGFDTVTALVSTATSLQVPSTSLTTHGWTPKASVIPPTATHDPATGQSTAAGATSPVALANGTDVAVVPSQWAANPTRSPVTSST
jgi:hypothetical protein